MISPDSIALVAKPWRGGLGTYVAMSLEAIFPGRVQIIYTYPDTNKEKISYRADRKVWRQRLTDKIDTLDADVVLFLNLLPEFGALSAKPSYVTWLTDSPESLLTLLQPFSRVFLSDPGYADNVVKAIGKEKYAGILPFACQPDVHRRVQQNVDARGFCFIANYDDKRDRILRHLFKNGRGIRVYGNFFLRHSLFWRYPSWFSPSVMIEEMGSIYAKCLASLNIHAKIVREGTNMRTFECASYGIPQAVEYRPGLEKLFDLDRELYVFRDEQELFEVMDEIEGDPAKAKLRAQRAHGRVLNEHTYVQRINKIISSL